MDMFDHTLSHARSRLKRQAVFINSTKLFSQYFKIPMIKKIPRFRLFFDMRIFPSFLNRQSKKISQIF